MANSNSKINARATENSKIVQNVEKKNIWNSLLNVRIPKINMGIARNLSLGVSVMSLSFSAGFISGFTIANWKQEELMKFVTAQQEELMKIVTAQVPEKQAKRQAEAVVDKV